MLYSFRLCVIFLLTVMLTSCMVGPDFKRPPAPIVEKYTESSLPKKTVDTPSLKKGGISQSYQIGAAISPQWWYLFHSKELNHLIDLGLANSPTLAAAQAALLQAQELLSAQIGSTLLPAFGSQISGQRQRFASASIGLPGASPIFNLINAGVNVSYTLDVFGGARRQIEAMMAQVDYQRYQFIAAYLTLTSNIVTTSISCSSLRAQIEATKSLAEEQDNQLTVLRGQYRLGAIAISDVLTQQTLVEQTKALIPSLEKSLSQSMHALSVLVGEFPDAAFPPVDLDKLTLPKNIPVSFPSQLVRQRPDIQASEALLHVASANIGVATANLFPQFTLSGNYGWSASAPSGLFTTASKVWSMSTSITQPIFQGGALLAQRRAAIDAFKQACAQYRQVVLQAFQNVADALRALETDAKALRSLRIAENAAKKTVSLTTEQYRLGGANYLALLIAQQQYEQAKIRRIQAQALRYTDTAALFQAMGGGWWERQSCTYWNCGKIVMGIAR